MSVLKDMISYHITGLLIFDKAYIFVVAGNVVKERSCR